MLVVGAASAPACTIFVLADANRALFFNNEDWFNPATRLWFVPAGKDHLGCAFIGFDNGSAQGGLNTAGLAFDWVSGFDETYVPDPALQPVRGNPSERMLESCTTVEEAIAFYRKFLEPDFERSRLLIADRTGASVVIGAREGRLDVVLRRDSRGFGWGRAALERELAKSPAPTVANGAAILRACLQPGEGGTKYSNVFDLKSGDITVFPSPERDDPLTLNLAAELAIGGHYYDGPKLRAQLTAPLQPLLLNMRRFVLDEFTPIPDCEPAVSARIRELLVNAARGTLRAGEFTPAFWKKISPAQKDIQSDMQRLGDFRALTLVDRRVDPAGIAYRYLVEFSGARVLGRYLIDPVGKVASLQSEFTELKPAQR